MQLASPDRLRELFDRLDPEAKRTRIEAEKKELETRYVKGYLDMLSQDRFAARHRQVAEDTPETDPTYKNKKAIAESQEEVARQQVMLTEHIADEYVLLEGVLEDMKEAGSDRLHGNRAARRRNGIKAPEPVAQE